MNLNLLAPRIQKEILFLPRIHVGQDPITERDLRAIALKPGWDMQIEDWQSLIRKATMSSSPPPKIHDS